MAGVAECQSRQYFHDVAILKENKKAPGNKFNGNFMLK
jgi:hypothetical protein